ncbi:MAG: AzlC family ABC transporter permease [Selenomonadaceae bacterium]|nr:AzlC family ABC transporter permease [Selenomonadaceae bacterium]
MRWKALRAAFPFTIPIFAGFWFLGIAYGIYMHELGFSFLYPMLMAMLIFGGSLEFVAGSMLVSSFAPLQTLLLALIIQARHLFYGIAMLDRFRGLGWKRFYLIFGMCDETFSINYSTAVPSGVDRGWFMFFVTLLNQVYWVSGAAIGGLLGGVLPFDTTGVEFAMTALFLVIFLEQWLKERQHITALVGIFATVACRLLFPVDSFLILTMVVILIALTVLRRPIVRRSMGKNGMKKAGESA